MPKVEMTIDLDSIWQRYHMDATTPDDVRRLLLAYDGARERVSLPTDSAALQAQLEETQWELAQCRADYAMLRGVARLCFGESASEKSARDLFALVTTDSHPGEALNMRFNRMKADLARVTSERDQARAELSDLRAHVERVFGDVSEPSIVVRELLRRARGK